MKNRNRFRRNYSKNKRRKPNAKVPMKIWNEVGAKAAKLNYDSEKMSNYFQELKEKEELKKIRKQKSFSPRINKRPNKQNKSRSHVNKYVPKRVILDDLREYRSSKTVSSISNSLAEFMIKTAAKNLKNSQKNALRSMVAFVVSEALNKAFEKELNTVEKVKTFIKVGQTIYKVVLWYDEHSKTYKTGSKYIKKSCKYSLQYKHFLKKHPTLKSVYNCEYCLTLEDFKSGKTCLSKEHLERYGFMIDEEEYKTPNSCPFYYYCNK